MHMRNLSVFVCPIVICYEERDRKKKELSLENGNIFIGRKMTFSPYGCRKISERNDSIMEIFLLQFLKKQHLAEEVSSIIQPE